MNLLFFGSDAFAIPSLKKLLESGHKILSVVTQPDKKAGRGQKITSCPVASFAKERGLKLVQPSTLKDKEALRELTSFKSDIFVVVAYGEFLPRHLIESASFQAVNLHPSLLPKYRGAAPIQWALLNGEKKTGVTTMTITKKMDAGDIYLQMETAIDDQEDFLSLQHRLSELGADCLLKTLEGIEKGILKPKPQDPKEVLFAPMFKKEDGHLDWKKRAFDLSNQIRALNPWPGTFCYFGDKRLKIFKASVLNEVSKEKPGVVIQNEEEIRVACGQGFLSLLEVQLEGKRRMSVKEFLKGHPILTGTTLK